MANFGHGSEPLKWNGGDRLRLIFPTERVAETRRELKPVRSFDNSEDSPSQQSRPGAFSATGPPQTKTANRNRSHNRMDYLAPPEIEKARSEAQQLKRMCSDENTDVGSIEKLLLKCQTTQKFVSKAVSKLCSIEAVDPLEVNEALDLNEVVSDAVGIGEEFVQSRRKSLPVDDGKEIVNTISSPQKTISTEVVALTRKKDIFSLICMLRAHDVDKRLEAALSLMK